MTKHPLPLLVEELLRRPAGGPGVTDHGLDLGLVPKTGFRHGVVPPFLNVAGLGCSLAVDRDWFHGFSSLIGEPTPTFEFTNSVRIPGQRGAILRKLSHAREGGQHMTPAITE